MTDEPKRRVLVKIDNFQGTIYFGGEYIPKCKKGDIIEVSNDTWNAMTSVYPNFFSLYTKLSEDTGECFYSAEIPSIVKTVGIVLTTYNRPQYLEQTLHCLNRTLFPKNISYSLIIIDDCSTNPETIRLIKEYISVFDNTEIIWNTANVRVWNSLKIGFDKLYHQNCDLIMNIDSDLLMKPEWLEKVINLYNKFSNTIISGFNAHSHPIFKTNEDYYVKNTIGGANMSFGWGMYLDLIRPAFEKQSSWDWGVCELLKKEDKKFIVTNPSVMDHIGIESTLGHGGADYATDWN
jgi:glycosyltransferase involved in cell wall biosynthesis